mmetsp:Transcript_21462/g.53054  ORF Transcript_21462/g.53054 Transcript_21462/m.53054 type:complete len:246 (-) Transcript_21462:749-1486(-)
MGRSTMISPPTQGWHHQPREPCPTLTHKGHPCITSRTSCVTTTPRSRIINLAPPLPLPPGSAWLDITSLAPSTGASAWSTAVDDAEDRSKIWCRPEEAGADAGVGVDVGLATAAAGDEGSDGVRYTNEVRRVSTTAPQVPSGVTSTKRLLGLPLATYENACNAPTCATLTSTADVPRPRAAAVSLSASSCCPAAAAEGDATTATTRQCTPWLTPTHPSTSAPPLPPPPPGEEAGTKTPARGFMLL